MLNVSTLFKEKINAEERYMIAKIVMILRNDAGDVVKTITFNDGEISDFDLLEELTSTEELPFGGVSANELTFSLDNINKALTPSNLEGPYYGLIGPGVEITASIGLETTLDEFEWVSLGTFYVSEWRAPSQSVSATITAYDRLFDVSKEPMPMLRITENLTVRDLFITVFRAIGFDLSDIIVDFSLDMRIPYGFFSESTIGEALKTLSQVGMCTVSMNRNNQVVVRSSLTGGTKVDEWNDDNQVIAIDNPEKYNAVFGRIAIGVYEPSIRHTSSLSRLSNIALDAGEIQFEKAEFSNTPVVTLDELSLQNSRGAVVKDVSYGTHHLTIVLENPTELEELVTIVAKGKYVSLTRRELSTNVANAKTKRQLEISNELVQTNAHAQMLTDVLVSAVTDPFAFYEIDGRGNPALEVGDVIEVSSIIDGVPPVLIKIIRSSLKYDGSIEGSIVGRRVN